MSARPFDFKSQISHVGTMNTLFKAPRSNQLEPTKLPDQIIPFNPEKLKQIVIRNGFPVHPKSGKIITNEVIKAIADLEE